MAAIDELLAIMARLRNKENGCPWDIEQTFASIAPHTIEEAYEVADSILRNDMQDLRSELGDLLLQVVFHAQIAEEEKIFDFNDVAQAIINKLIARHPHIFGDEKVLSAEEQIHKWEEIKTKEREEKAKKEGKSASILDDIPHTLPSLLRACKLQKRAATVGFNWDNHEDILLKLEEEVAELEQEITDNNTTKIEEEIGDILFVISNLCNFFKVNPEMALSKTNAKFERRFNYIEQALATQNRTPQESTLAEMDALWNEAKTKEKTTA